MSVRLRKQKTIPLLFVSFSGPDCGCVVLCCAVPLSGNFFFFNQNALLSTCVWYFHFGPHKQFLISIFIYFKEK